jgi:hypothetical protein
MKYKYIFTTLAVNEPYISDAIDGFSDLKKHTTADFNITTNKKLDNIDNINFDFFSLNNYVDHYSAFKFYLNLKSLALKPTLDKGYDFVIFQDADFKITEQFHEDKMFQLFDYMNSNNLDALFERPSQIGWHKENPDQCFWNHKIHEYKLHEHTKWDDAHVFNEQFMVFRVNWKFRMFVMKWEQFLWYGMANKLSSYPEGFEIGVSALESDMNYNYDEWRAYLRDCFTFTDKTGSPHIRF